MARRRRKDVPQPRPTLVGQGPEKANERLVPISQCPGPHLGCDLLRSLHLALFEIHAANNCAVAQSFVEREDEVRGEALAAGVAAARAQQIERTAVAAGLVALRRRRELVAARTALVRTKVAFRTASRTACWRRLKTDPLTRIVPTEI